LYVYNEVTSEPTITRHTTIVRKTIKAYLYVYDEVTSEPTITRHTTIVRKTIKAYLYVYNEVSSDPTITQHTTIVRKTIKAYLYVYNEVTSDPTITRHTTIVRKTIKVLYTERLLLWSRHFATRSSLAAAAARNTFPRQLQTNFESFPNNCCISRDCTLTGYFIISMWK
jgi:hypothetical protein